MPAGNCRRPTVSRAASHCFPAAHVAAIVPAMSMAPLSTIFASTGPIEFAAEDGGTP